MTKEEALLKVKGYLTDCLPSDNYEEVEKIIKALEQQPCEDAVSRQALIDLAKKGVLVSNGNLKSVTKAINGLPSVIPIRPKGEWEYDETIQNWRCSKCNETPKTLGYVGTKEFMTEHFKFCNHCGADMRGEKDAT